MDSSRSRIILVTGIALIAAPIVALGLKFFSFGWAMVIVIYGPVFLLVIGYALQIVIAVQGFLRRSPLFETAPGRKRAIVAAWLTSIGFMLVGVFMPDGGDNGYGSTLQVWLGAYSHTEWVDEMHEATDGLTNALFLIAAAVWLIAYLWLFVEWIIALVQRRIALRRARVGIDAAPAAGGE